MNECAPGVVKAIPVAMKGTGWSKLFSACETEEDRFIWTSGGSAEFEAVSFACGKKCRMMRPVPQAAGTLKLHNNFADEEDDLPLPPGQLDHGEHHVQPKTKRQPSPCAVLEFGS
jgi:hypothetical protein